LEDEKTQHANVAEVELVVDFRCKERGENCNSKLLQNLE
jgi:hypothetical protein